MLRKNVRLRKEYLYRKSLEGKEKELYEKKRKLKRALEEGKSIPTELRFEEQQLTHDAEMDDELTRVPKNHMDDEYERAGVQDPKLFLTTSRDPSSRLKQFAKEISQLIPNCQRRNRGNLVLNETVEACRVNEMTDLILVYETRGEPDTLVISHLPYGPTAYFSLLNVVTRHDIGQRDAVPQQLPHLIFSNFTTKLGQRTQNILKYLFPVAKDDAHRIVTFSNKDDYISFRQHMYQQVGPEIILKELGPRFEMKLYQIKLGTIENDTANNEWVLRPYLNNATKKNFL